MIAIESQLTVPFSIERVYYIFGTVTGVQRGCHAHRNLNQLCVAIAGGVTLTIDDGQHRVAVRLDDPSRGLTIGPMVWREMDEFTDDCVLLVLADRYFDDADYIRHYDQFIRALAF